MRKYMEKYIKEIEVRLNKKDKVTEYEINNMKDKILFFEHERLIHLLVTLFYCLFILTFLALSLLSYIFLIPFFIGIIFLIFYIRHYFFLENSVQYLYKLYDKYLENYKK